LISAEDVRVLRLLVDHDIRVSLECGGIIVDQVSVEALLQNAHYLADRCLWFVPTTAADLLNFPRSIRM
jgi:hypothetical protein